MNEDAIEALAAGWLVEREEGFSADRAQAFARWCDADRRHRAAIARLEAAHQLLLQLPRIQEDEKLAPRVERMMQPKRLAPVIPFPQLRWMAAVAAAVVAIASMVWRKPAHPDFHQEYASTAAGPRSVTLPDTSRIDLEPNSDVLVNFSAPRRDIELARGEANFTVAKDPSRPFIVAAGKIKVRAVGTVFKVSYGATAVQVVVTEGKVQVSREGAPDALASALVAGQQLELSLNETVDTPQVAAAFATAPQASELLKFNGMPLARAIELFNQRNKVKLLVDDPELAESPVDGTFDADKPEAFVRILEQGGQISAEWMHDSTFVLRKAN